MIDIRRMSPSMIALVVEEENKKYQRGVKHLCDNGLTKVPTKYIWPEPDRPIFTKPDKLIKPKQNLKLPIIDIAELLGPNRSHVLRTIAEACENYGFFQVSSQTVNYIDCYNDYLLPKKVSYVNGHTGGESWNGGRREQVYDRSL